MSTISTVDFLATHSDEVFIICLNSEFICYSGQQLIIGENNSIDETFLVQRLHDVIWLINEYDSYFAYITLSVNSHIDVIDFRDKSFIVRSDNVIVTEIVPCAKFFFRHPSVVRLVLQEIPRSINRLPIKILLAFPYDVRKALIRWPTLLNKWPIEVLRIHTKTIKQILYKNPLFLEYIPYEFIRENKLMVLELYQNNEIYSFEDVLKIYLSLSDAVRSLLPLPPNYTRLSIEHI